MKRLPFRLKEYAPRDTWASAKAQEVWEPRISRISNLYMDVERESVKRGVKPSVLQYVSPEQLPAYMADAAKSGCIALPLSQAQNVDGYGSGTGTGVGWSYKVALTRQELAAEWASAWVASDDDRIGKLLGYPECCRKFFQRVWNEERWFDTTVPQFASEPAGKLIRVSPYCNLLWRWHGVRLVSHLPCSAQCEATREMGQQMLYAFENVNMEVSKWAWEILHWPVLYTSLHGVAEITTPIHRFHVASDALAEKLEYKFYGEKYPEEGASGGFPHRRKDLFSITKPKAPVFYNGFQSLKDQNEAHEVLLRLTKDSNYVTIVDLGCGDGTLLSKIPAARRIGIEINPETAALATKKLHRVIVGDVTDRELVLEVLEQEQPDLVLAQRDRNPPETLLPPVKNLLSYTYEGQVSAQLLGSTEAKPASRS